MARLTGVDHPGRAFLAEVLAVRYMGLKQKSIKPDAAGARGPGDEREGAAARRDLPRRLPDVGGDARRAAACGFSVNEDKGILKLHLPEDLAFLDGEHLRGPAGPARRRRGVQADGTWLRNRAGLSGSQVHGVIPAKAGISISEQDERRANRDPGIRGDDPGGGKRRSLEGALVFVLVVVDDLDFDDAGLAARRGRACRA